ncbi:MAG: UDP-glucose 4-epimerase GalE [Polyangiales bacterium]
MHVLVTGGAGYIGSVVVEELLRAEHRVVALDDLSKGHRDAVDPAATFVHGDLGDGIFVERTLRDNRIDAVVHMAADSIVGESVTDPARYYKRNVTTSIALLDAMRAARTPRLVFSSTAAVYGEPEKQPIDESAALAPTNPYGDTKLAIERALRWYDDAYGLRATSLRYFNAAGASEKRGERHDPETHLLPLVLDVAAGRRPSVAIFGEDYPTPDGTCVRDYIHVVDLARAHVLALEALEAGAPSSTFNLGCGGGHSVKQVIEVARRVTGAPIPTVSAPRRAGDPAVLVASSEAIAKALGWKPALGDLTTIVESAWRLRQSA